MSTGEAFGTVTEQQARRFQRVHEDIWPRLRAIYGTSPTPTPHQHRPGDWVYIRRYCWETLEPRWKGPYTVVLKTPTALKVDGVTTWVHPERLHHQMEHRSIEINATRSSSSYGVLDLPDASNMTRDCSCHQEPPQYCAIHLDNACIFMDMAPKRQGPFIGSHV
uniref:Murine leukemia virus integrase C-terminal domain-containing protein n=1 Tax=Myotis myotis TaxID=51298 RepID=A0A7J7RMX2_MYOMY|nr:hypothetical protein mMyoMyo1_010256 [Myotis myotis]